MLEGLGFLADGIWWAVEFLARGLVGWRFLASPRYRRTVTARWKDLPTSTVALEIMGAAVGVVASALLVFWLLAGLTP